MQLIVAVALWIAPVASADPPQSSARARATLYQDDDDTTVFTGAVEANAIVEDVVGARASYVVDAVTTASVDVIAAATERWDERRDEVRGGLDLYLDHASISATVARSTENDYASWRFAGGASVDLASHATTLAIGFGLTLSEVGRADDPSFAAAQRVLGGDLRLVQVVDERTLVAVGYGLARVDGYQASPYRYVRIGDGSFSRERHPDERTRHTFVFRIRRMLGDDVALAIDERVYADDWSLLATSTNATLTFSISEALDLEVRNRFHFQSAASFWQESYAQETRFVSNDRELATSLDDYAGGAAVVTLEDVGPFAALRFDLRADVFYYHYFDYAYLAGRVGTLVSLGAEGSF
jgi:hypothetical protein